MDVITIRLVDSNVLESSDKLNLVLSVGLIYRKDILLHSSWRKKGIKRWVYNWKRCYISIKVRIKINPPKGMYPKLTITSTSLSST